MVIPRWVLIVLDWTHERITKTSPSRLLLEAKKNWNAKNASCFPRLKFSINKNLKAFAIR